MREVNGMKTAALSWISRHRATVYALGPYAAAALVIPGGSVIAALVWLYQNRKSPGAVS
jgi:hypothetical protein